MKNLAVVMFAVIASIAMGQSMTSTKSGQWLQPQIISNFPDVLVSGGNVNAWHPMDGAAVSITAGPGLTMVVNGTPTGTVYSYNRGWSKHSEYGPVHEIAMGGDQNIYALYGTCSGGYNFGRWNGSGFTLLSSCYESFSLSADLSTAVLLIDSNGRLWQGDTAKGGYQQVSGAPYPLISVATIATSPLAYFAVKTDNSIWGVNGSSIEQLPGQVLAVASGPELGQQYVIGMNGYIFHYNGTGWDEIAGIGSFTTLAVDAQGPWAIGPTVSNNNIYHLSETGIDWSRQFTGTVTCNVPPPQGQQICPTFTHTATARIQTGQKYGAPANAPNWSNSGTWNLTAHVHTNDVFDCLDHINGDCYVYTFDDAMSCSAGASVDDVSDPVWGVDFGIAINVQRWIQNAGEEGPNDHHLPNNSFLGFWDARVASDITLACPAGTSPSCGVAPPLGSEMSCKYGDAFEKFDCYEKINTMITRYVNGQPSPWVFYIPWVSGSTFGQQSCAPGSLPGFAAWGQWWLVPPCQ